MFQNLNFKISDIFEYIIEKYLLKLTFVFSKNVYFRNCGTFKIILVYPTQKYVAFSQLFLDIKLSWIIILMIVIMVFFQEQKSHYISEVMIFWIHKWQNNGAWRWGRGSGAWTQLFTVILMIKSAVLIMYWLNKKWFWQS